LKDGMRIIRFGLAAFLGVAALAGCSSQPVTAIKSIFQSKGEPQLQTGIRQYEDGKYAAATTSLQDALSAGLSNADQVTANKYLAFISCTQGRERQCRAYFRRALELNPAFELEPNEAGHPMWGPVFKNVKSGGRR
jgi:Tfp pilus assembly protein PilF